MEAKKRSDPATPTLLPPRPDLGAVGVAAAAAALILVGGSPLGLAIVTGAVVGVIALPLFLLFREIALFHSRRVLRPEEAGLVAEWLQAAGAAVGAGSVTVLYTYRRGAGLQVMQLGSTAQGEHIQGSLLAHIHRAAWNALPAAFSSGGRVYVAVPARIMEWLYSIAGKSRSTAYLRPHSKGEVKTVYRILRELAQAASRGASRLYTAYTATKAFTRLVVSGAIRLDPQIADKVDSLVPAEPPWIRHRVVKQLREEMANTIPP